MADYDLFYRAFGSGDTVLLVLHGGPGGSSDLLAPLAQLGSDDVTVVVLFGSSWGGMLAQEYALHYPENVSKLILSATLHDVSDAIEKMKAARREELSEEELETVQEFESKRDFDDPEYQELTENVYSERLLRIEKPNWWEKAEINKDIYGLMWGPSEYALAETARLRDWSVKERLAEIELPTLVITGEHDEIGPEISRDIADRLPNAQLRVLDDASHAAFWEQPEEYRDVVEAFLEQ